MRKFAFVIDSAHSGCKTRRSRCLDKNATALKPTPEAGRRGGESIARQMWCQHLIVYACEPPDGAAALLACDGAD